MEESKECLRQLSSDYEALKEADGVRARLLDEASDSQMAGLIQKYIVAPNQEKKGLFGIKVKQERISVCKDVDHSITAVEQFLMSHVDGHTKLQVKVQQAEIAKQMEAHKLKVKK